MWKEEFIGNSPSMVSPKSGFYDKDKEVSNRHMKRYRLELFVMKNQFAVLFNLETRF